MVNRYKPDKEVTILTSAKILIVEDEGPATDGLAERLRRFGYTVCAVVTSGQQALEKAAELSPDLALIDLELAGPLEGPDVADRMRERFDIPVIYLTTGAAGDLLQRARTTDPFGYVLKPVDARQLHLNVETALGLHEREKKGKEAENKLQETVDELQKQSRLMRVMQTIFDSMSEGVIAVDANGDRLVFNASAERIIGFKAQMKKSPGQWTKEYGIYLPDQVTPIPTDQLVLARAIRGESINNREVFIRNLSKPEGVSVSTSGRPLLSETGESMGGVVVIRDITKQKETENRLEETIDELRRQTQLFQTIFNSMSEGVVAADKDGNELLYNPSAEHIIGFRGVQDGTKQWTARHGFFFPDQVTVVPTHELALARAMRGKSTDEREMFIRNSNKPEGAYISVNGRPLLDDAGESRGGVIVFRDITKQKETESKLQETVAQLQHQTQLFQAVFNSISDGVVVADENGRFTLFNPSAERIVGMGITQAEPDQWTAEYGIFYADKMTPVITAHLPLVRAMHGEETDEMELFVRNPFRPEGVYISVNGRPIRSPDTAKGGVIAFRDITERARAEEALAQAFTQGRLEVVDTVLHNIGNAVNSVTVGIGTLREQLMENRLIHRFSSLAEAIKAHQEDWLAYLQHDPQGQQVRPFVLALADDFVRQNEQLLRTIERVSRRVNHIVDIVRTQRNFDSTSMTRKDVNLRQAISGALRMLHESFVSRGIRTHVNYGNAPVEIRIQESQFHQMLVNVLKNAMEAIDERRQSGGLKGRPRVEIRAHVRREFLVLDVVDNGIGIAQKNVRAIFTAGYTTKPGGSGLGLHSAANFITGSGGKIHPLSDGVGLGTTMRIMLRLDAVSPKAHTARGGIP